MCNQPKIFVRAQSFLGEWAPYVGLGVGGLGVCEAPVNRSLFCPPCRASVSYINRQCSDVFHGVL